MIHALVDAGAPNSNKGKIKAIQAKRRIIYFRLPANESSNLPLYDSGSFFKLLISGVPKHPERKIKYFL